MLCNQLSLSLAIFINIDPGPNLTIARPWAVPTPAPPQKKQHNFQKIDKLLNKTPPKFGRPGLQPKFSTDYTTYTGKSYKALNTYTN
jgi:hypothetical protein